MLGTRFQEALVYAAQTHASQVRKGTEIPYLAHLLAVASLVVEDGGDEDQAVAALLHDAVEDQGGTARLEEIRERFGPAVASIVEQCSDTLEQPKPPWCDRKRRYLEHLETAPPEVLRVSVADKLHNARAILWDVRDRGVDVFARFKAPRPCQLWYYRRLTDLFARRYPGSLSRELRRVVEELESTSGDDGLDAEAWCRTWCEEQRRSED